MSFFLEMKVLWVLLTIPSLSFTQVSIIPSVAVVPSSGGNASFRCLSTSVNIMSIQWLMNGSATLTNEAIASGNAVVVFNGAVGIGLLHVINIPLEFNETSIQCSGVLTSGTNFTTVSAMLLLQDLLSAVGFLSLTLQNSTISLTWTAPFTLDITGVDPDITYCVGVVNSTSSSTLHSQCGITAAEYEYPIPPDSACHMYMFTVTPVNVVGNGSASFKILTLSPPIVVHTQTSLPNTGTGGMDPDIIIYHIIMSDPVCSAEISLIDTSTEESITLLNSDLTIMLTNVSFTSEKLRLNRKYRIMVNASNINGSSVFSGDISSHDIVETGVHMNPLRIHTQYLLDSQAAGGLFSFLFIDANGVIDFRKSTYLCLEKNTSQSYVLPFTQSPELYVISAYDIEEEGLLYSGEAYPATTSTHVISGPGPSTSSEIEDCDVISDEQVVCVQCSFPPNSTSLGFLVVVQRDSISKARTLLVNTTQPGQALEPVTVEVEEGGVYQVTVFAIRGEMGIVGSAVEYSTQIEILATEDEDEGDGLGIGLGIGLGVGLGVLTVIVVILGGVMMAFVCHRAVRSNSEITIEKTDVYVEPLEGEAVEGSVVYEEIGEVRDPNTFNYTQNILYGKFSSGIPSELNTEL